MKKITAAGFSKNPANIVICLMFFILTVGMGVTPGSAQQKHDFEPPPVFFASDILPADSLSGPNYQIGEYVYNDGFTNIYNLSTDYGWLRLEGTALLNIRLKELKALQVMEQVKGTETYRKAAKKAATGPLRLAKGVVTKPIQTTKGVVTGVGSYFRELGHSIFGKRTSQEEGVGKTAIGFANAKRRFAFQFGVDPYSSYQPMQSRLNEIVWAGFAGGMTVQAAFIAIPGGTGTALQVTGFSGKVNERLRDYSPPELKKMNREALDRMKVNKSLAKVFLNNPDYSPSKATYMVSALETMDGVMNRWIFVECASLAKDESVALYYQRQAELMAGYHANIEPVALIAQLGKYPCLKTKDGVVVCVFPSDHIAWTESLAAQADGTAAEALKGVYNVTGQELWFEGTVSRMARKKAEESGWKVVENAGKKLTLK